MDKTAAEIKREKYFSPRNVAIRKIAKRYEWTWNCIGIQIAISQILSTILLLAIMAMKVLEAKDSGGDILGALDTSLVIDYTIPIAAVCYIVANTLAAFIALKVTKAARFRDYLHKPKISAGVLILAVFATLGISNLDSIIMNFFSSIFSASNDQITESISSGLFSDNTVLVIMSIAYIAVIGPFLEELLCRGAILTLGGHISPKFGIFASAFIFGVFHLNISQFFNAFILGLILGYITYKSKSIIPSTIMHIVNNSTAVIQMYLAEKVSEELYTTISAIFILASIVIGIIALILLILYYKKNNNEENQGAIIVNKPLPDDEVAELGLNRNELTANMFFTRWSFFVVFGFFILMCVYSYMLV